MRPKPNVHMATTTIADVERAVKADARLQSRIAELRRSRTRAEAAYSRMVSITEHAARRLADPGGDVSLPPGEGALGEDELGPRLVAAEAAAHAAVDAARACAQGAARMALELVSERYRPAELLIVDVDDRPAPEWTHVMVAHVTAQSSVPDFKVAMF
jgi:hypothetical protein